MQDLHFTEEELLAIDCPQDFAVFLKSVDEEYGIYDLDDFLRFYFYHEYFEHCNVIIGFKKAHLR